MFSRVSLVLALAAVTASMPVSAQQDELQRCATIEDSLQRLVCFDKLAEKYRDNPPQEQPQKAVKAERQQTHRDAAARFGIEHKNAKDMESIDKLTVKIASRRQDPYGNWIITLANGQVWKQTESVGYFSWDEEDTYYIERGALNSFFFGREGANRRFRVTRVE